ncbi:helix-turn-helix domain-containing protein [Bradyrhizobium sp. AS23.2]|uniref:IclR family transcriptional regulator n=1 Tax=Bradyrhizobium sp. AS23.2 TaxID=1680155 RepID=UPI00093F8833|nr:helix-turn-helix domain-containing protein [Bradyrhizobium sp. AS23.2]
MKGARLDARMPPRRGRRPIVAERISTGVGDPSVTVIEANRYDGSFRTADGEPEPSVIKSAHRVLRIFEYFAEIQRPASMTEIARRLNYPASSTSALLKCLVELGYLDSDRHARTYVPTARISLLGGWNRDRVLPRGNLETITRELHEATRLTTFVVSRNQLCSQYIYVLQGTTPVRYYLEPGGLRLLTRSTPGRVLLSLMSDDEVQRIVLRINAEELSSTPPMKFAELKPALATIRQQGFAYTRNSGTPGLSTIAMQLTVLGHASPLAIAVAGSSAIVEIEAKSIIGKMRDLIESQAPGVLPPFDIDAQFFET